MIRRADFPQDAWIDELERDLGVAAVARLLANAGGQRRYIPKRAEGSRLAEEIGENAVRWLSDRFAGTELEFPSPNGRSQQARASALRAAILEAGLTDPNRSVNDIAKEFGVSASWVSMLRKQLRGDLGLDGQLSLPLD